jgi:hypothetical protein
MSKKNVLQFKVTKDKRLIGKEKNIESQTLQVFKSKGHRITEKEIEKLVKNLKEKTKGKTEFSVVGVNGDMYRMLKRFNQNDVHVQTYDDYHQGVNFESENFMEFYQLSITFHKYV